MRKYGNPNRVSTNIADYSLMLIGEPKIGKTTFIHSVLNEVVGIDGHIFVEFGRERGAACIEGIPADDIKTWEEWLDFVDEIVDKRTTDYRDVKVIVIDTHDNYTQLAEKEAIRLWNKDHPSKKAKSLKQSWNGFDAYKKVNDLMYDQIERLEDVGIVPWFVGHSKNKEVKDVYSDETYNILTSDQAQVYFSPLNKTVQFMCMVYFDRQFNKEKTGRKNVVTKEEITRTVVAGEKRKIRFRSNDSDMVAGGRFRDIAFEIDLDARAFIDTITAAIEAEIKRGGGSVEERKKENASESAERMRNIEQKTNEKMLDDMKNSIGQYLTNNKSDIEGIVKPILQRCKEMGYNTPKEITNIEDARTIFDMCK